MSLALPHFPLPQPRWLSPDVLLDESEEDDDVEDRLDALARPVSTAECWECGCCCCGRGCVWRQAEQICLLRWAEIVCVGAMVVAVIFFVKREKGGTSLNSRPVLNPGLVPCKVLLVGMGEWKSCFNLRRNPEEWCKRAPVDVMRRWSYKPLLLGATYPISHVLGVWEGSCQESPVLRVGMPLTIRTRCQRIKGKSGRTNQVWHI